MTVEEQILELIDRRGPVTGAEIRDALGGDPFCQWKACRLSERLVVRPVGRRYLRLDQRLEGYARLSPSILREFLTYSVIGLADAPAALLAKRDELAASVVAVSRAKLELARTVVASVAGKVAPPGHAGRQYAAEGVAAAPVAGPRGAAEGAVEGAAAPVGEAQPPEDRFCVILAGDIVYDMAHDVPRPEHSTGRMVRGSDVDLVFIFADDAPEELMQQVDEVVYQQKYRYLINPSFREEIDYVVKRMSRLEEQAEFDTFKKMVACKILDEGVFLHGNRFLFDSAKALLRERGVCVRLQEMERSAVRAREIAEQYLLSTEQTYLAGDDLYLFYTADESEEFE